jgi:hypothetical protein
MMVYAYPRLSKFDLGFVRLLGPGLGNLLFPWARCVVACRRRHLIPLAPTWPQIKFGPLLRREPDKRTYAGLFEPRSGEVTGLRKMRLLMTAERIPEWMPTRATEVRGREPAIVEFAGMNGLFGPFLDEHAFILEQLRAMTKPAILEAGDRICPQIGIHVRFGDFSSPRNDEERRTGRRSTRLPIDWYIRALQNLRTSTGCNLEASLFSDGLDEELWPLLALQGVTRVTAGSSVADLLAMSRSKILIASGSTFSMWASYLGRMPVIWYPGQLRQRLYPSAEGHEVEYSPGECLPDPFINSIKRIAGASP